MENLETKAVFPDADAPDSMAEPQQSPRAGAKDDTLCDLIEIYHYQTLRRAELRRELEKKVRAIQHRAVSDDVPARDSDRIPRPLSVPSFTTLSVLDSACAALGYNRVALDRRTSIGTGFVYHADEDELEAVSDLEMRIRLLDSQLDVLVEKILDEVPTTARQALVKLKMLTSIMLDSECLETDYFACLVAECAQTMEASPALAAEAG